MTKFCTKCGRLLTEGKKCTCSPQNENSVLIKLFERIGIGVPGSNSANLFENGQKIVPDIIQANEGEIPVRQYEAATLRSRVRGQYAKGKLQITNKRVVFRAAGVSYQGTIAQQHEFAISEIAGIEVKKANRISPLNVFFSLLLTGVIVGSFEDIFSRLVIKSEVVAVLLSLILGVVSVLPFFLLHKKFWLKLLSLCCGIGALSATGELFDISLTTFLNGLTTNISDFLNIALLVIWILNIVLVSLVPDLVLSIKTKGATEAFIIRRKQHATLFKQEVEYTGFSEVVPGKEIDSIISEVGAIIDDIQTLGDMALEKWKEGKTHG